jgi:hypothetical protein
VRRDTVKREFTITADTRPRFIAWLSNLDLTKAVRVTVEPEKKERTNPMNRYMWALHTLAGEHCGMTRDEMHCEMCIAYFGEKRIETKWGTVIRRPIRTTTTNEAGERDVLAGEAFMRFVDWLESKYATDLGVWIDQREAA